MYAVRPATFREKWRGLFFIQGGGKVVCANPVCDVSLLKSMQKAIAFISIVLVIVLAGGAFATPALATHGGSHPTKTIPTGITTAGGFIAVLEVITDWIFVFLLVLAVVFIVLAAFQFVTGGGDPSAVSGARTKLIYAAVGIGVAVLARGAPEAVRDMVGT
jgi:hypothetical protein